MSSAAQKASAALFSMVSLEAAATRATTRELSDKIYHELRIAVCRTSYPASVARRRTTHADRRADTHPERAERPAGAAREPRAVPAQQAHAQLAHGAVQPAVWHVGAGPHQGHRPAGRPGCAGRPKSVVWDGRDACLGACRWDACGWCTGCAARGRWIGHAALRLGTWAGPWTCAGCAPPATLGPC